MRNKKAWAFLLLLIFPAVTANAYWVWSPQEGKFVNAEGAAQDSAEEQFDYAMKLYREKNFEAAEKKFREILKNYPQSVKAPEAQYRLGIVYEETGDYLKAFKAYRRLVETYPQSERFAEVIEREFRIGNVFLGGRKAKFAGLELLPSLPKAVEVFKQIIEHAPYSEFGDKSQFQLATAYKKWRHFSDAVEAFQGVIDQYPSSELVPQARYEVAECSFLRSASNVRDQRAMEEASRQVSRFLGRYPDTEAAEKAAKIRQEIDEKNAEKNYRIGLYYEKENYIESALIYYQDVAARYQETLWGQKASDKLRSLKEPAKYVTQQQAVLDEQQRAFENKLRTLEKGGDPVELDITKRSLERLRKHQKTFEKDKKEGIERRKKDLVRREKELKEKFKNLEKKQKRFAKNESPDFKSAMDRWYASLVEEQEALAQERNQLAGWREDLGIPDSALDMSFLPFVGPEATELQKIQNIEAKKFFKIAEEKKNILDEKETLYKHYSEVSSLLGQKPLPFGLETTAAVADTAKIKAIQQEIQQLEKKIESANQIYEKHYGKSAFSSVVGGVRKSVDFLNPFDAKGLEAMSQQELLERQMHLKEQTVAEQNLIQTLTRALDSQLALEEQKRMLSKLGVSARGGSASGGKPGIDPSKLRKDFRALERAVRRGYEEIEERHEHKKQLLKELQAELKRRETEDPGILRIVRKVGAPAVGAGKLVKAFFVGLPHEDLEITQQASNIQGPDSGTMKRLEAEIKTESILIQAKNRELEAKRKELEILKAQASLAGGYKFRSIFIDVPYVFFDEAMESAKRLVPKKDRDVLLMERLNQETVRLEKLKGELKEVESRISSLDKAAPAAPAKPAASEKDTVKAKSAQEIPSEEALKKEIQTLEIQLQTKSNSYEQERLQGLASQHQNKKSSKTVKKDSKTEKKFSKELTEIEDGLRGLIRKETELETEERDILEKRITHIEKEVQKTHSKAVVQDLIQEKEHMEERISQLESRQDFLTQEIKRFQPLADSPNPRS